MRLKRSQVVTAGAAALATVGILGGTLAYFTDYDSKDLSAKAGTLKMEIADATTDLTNGLTVINPGDSNLEFPQTVIQKGICLPKEQSADFLKNSEWQFCD